MYLDRSEIVWWCFEPFRIDPKLFGSIQNLLLAPGPFWIDPNTFGSIQNPLVQADFDPTLWARSDFVRAPIEVILEPLESSMSLLSNPIGLILIAFVFWEICAFYYQRVVFFLRFITPFSCSIAPGPHWSFQNFSNWPLSFGNLSWYILCFVLVVLVSHALRHVLTWPSPTHCEFLNKDDCVNVLDTCERVLWCVN